MSSINVQENDDTYAEVPCEPVPNHFLVDDTYEQIPDSRPTARADEMSHTNTYETLTDLKPKQILSARALKVSVNVMYGKLKVSVSIITFFFNALWNIIFNIKKH